MKKLIFLIIIMLLTINCDDNPVDVKENQSPIIFSLTAFPDVVRPNDSLIVICNAFDPDADTLVYDWYTSGVVKIKGLPPWAPPALYNSYENSQIFYAPDSQYVSAPQDTFWIQCAARDRKGKSDNKILRFIVIKDF